MSTSRLGQVVVDGVDTALDKLVVPGYSSIGSGLRRHWWPADPPPFQHPVDVVVTGASSGLGAAAALGLARLGARVHLVGRSRDRLAGSAGAIRARVADAELVVHETDISDLDAVAALVGTLRDTVDGIHAVIHCAGVMPPERTETPQGHEAAFATHVLGPFLLTQGLRSLLRADGDARVVFVTSGGAYSAELSDDLESTQDEYRGIRAYARTKRMQITLAEQLAAAYPDPQDPVVHSMHPGWSTTPGVTDSLPGFAKVLKPVLRSPADGADTMVWLAAAPDAARTSGLLWQDRRPRAAYYLPWQSDDAAVRQVLWDTCVAAAAGYLSTS